MSRPIGDIIRIGLALLAVSAVVACAPESAKQARGDLKLTAGAAAQASDSARAEAGLMGGVANDIMFDVQNIKEVEAWFDQGRPVSFD